MRSTSRRPGIIVSALMALALLAAACTVELDGHPVAKPGPGPSSTPPPEPAHPVRVPGNVPMTRVEPGQKPPQFILFSFDGVGVTENWDLFLDTAAETDARFTALMAGTYFLTDAARNHYTGPGYKPGQSGINFGGTKADVIEEIEYLNRTYWAGHEMGTHFVGHWCEGTEHPGNDWSTADWKHELAQFFSLMENWRRNNGITTGPDLAYGPEEVVGGRTQCLEGTQRALFPALRAYDFIWDSSFPAPGTGISWPRRHGDLWEFGIPVVYSPPLRKRQMALDYNFWFSFNGAKDQPRQAPRIRRIVKETYDYMYRRAFEGNRAPIVVANHFNEWSGNAFNPATADFMRETCTRPETICATHRDVVAWLEIQDPALIEQWQALPPVAVDAHR